jgi:hypothetical protein
LVLCAVGAVRTGWGEIPAASHFADEPADALVRQMEPGLDFSLTLPDTPPDVLAGRWQVSSGEANKVAAVTAADPVSGLEVARRSRWLPEPRLVLIETTLTNGSAEARQVEQVALARWTFRLRDAEDEGYRKLTYRADVWYGSTYWTGPDWTRVGKNWHHPGTNTPSVRRFTAPRDGHVRITGRVFKLHTDGDGVRAAVRHGRRTVWQAEIDGKDDRGLEPEVELDVRAGDAIRFVVHKRGKIFCDTTGWDPVIAYDDGPSFQASESFSTTRQGLGGWSYEMEAEGQPDVGLPRLQTFAPDFALRHAAIPAGKTATITDDDALPIAFISDGARQSGVTLAISGHAPWQLHTTLHGEERLRIELTTRDGPPAGSEPAELTLKPGESLELPRVVLGAYAGGWLAGATRLGRFLDGASGEPGEPAVEALRSQLLGAFDRLHTLPGHGGDMRMPPRMAGRPELDLWLMIQAEWRHEDKLTETAESYAEATARHLDRAARLLRDLQDDQACDFLADERAQLEKLAKLAERPDLGLEDRRSLYQRVRWLKRHVAMSNPRMDFGKLLFAKRVPTSYSHLVMQYFGWRARPGGGIFVLEDPGYSLACRDVLDGRLAGGCVLEPRLSYDGKRIVFSYVECDEKPFQPADVLNDVDEGFYHVYEVGVDGTGLRQLTRGPYDDLMPTYLPDGGIAFCSTRRRGYARCFGAQFSRRWHVYTLHRMDADGGNVRTLSVHDTNEWFPAVSHTGLILYARWDYIDRDAVTHQNLWATRPDGTNPFALWGNATASPHCTFQLQPIPNSPKVVFAASAHHSVAGGSIAIVDPTVNQDGQRAITRITPEIPFPEAESRNVQEYYTAPWPLSEEYFLVGYSPTPLVWEPGANKPGALGIYLLDAWGNRELIYRDPDIGSTNPCPLRARPKPPVLSSMVPPDTPGTVPQETPAMAPAETPRSPPPEQPAVGEMVLIDVYEGLGDVPRGSIKRLRIVQLFPKTTNVANQPPIGVAREENGRAILGTVPVEPDGSARFLVPAGKPVLFQALDEDGFAYQTMRSLTYVQPGERVSCIGCHEHRRTAPAAKPVEGIALRRGPSRIKPGALGGRPFSYVEIVQPVLDRHCVACHGKEEPDGGIDLTGTPHEGFTRSYVSLCGGADFWHRGTNPENAAKALVPRFGGRNQVQVTPPGGIYGALGSRLVHLLRDGHEDVELTPEEFRRLAAWIDLNAIHYGVNSREDQARQLRGEIVPMPDIQ